jgi:hypothetical protein
MRGKTITCSWADNPRPEDTAATRITARFGLLDNVTTLSTRLAFTMLDIPRHLPLHDHRPAHSSASGPEAAEFAGKSWKTQEKHSTIEGVEPARLGSLNSGSLFLL